MPIVTLAEAKAQLNIDPADDRNDDEVSSYLEALTPVIERESGQVVTLREFTDELDLYRARTFTLARVPVVELLSVTRLDAPGTVYEPLNLHVNPTTGKVTVLLGPTLSGLLSVVYRAGYEEPPDNFKKAALVVLQHVWELQRGVGVAQQRADDMTPGQGFLVPNRAKELLGAPMPGLV